MTEKTLFIGCACDRKFVEPTATMLVSVDQNGEVPDATVILAGFGLDELDRATLRAAAGRLGEKMRFLDITREMLHAVDTGGYTDAYPLPVLGRLFVADHIDAADARLLTLDSDMIVRVSLRPLQELDLGKYFFAAIHDPPRKHDLNYLNSGLTLSDVAGYREHEVATRALRWLAEQDVHPKFPDQDALNHVLGSEWYRLEETWNHFCYAPHHFEPEDWDRGNVAHFAGPKPWDYVGHAGERLYYFYNSELHRRLEEAEIEPRFRRSPRIDAVMAWAIGEAAGSAALPVFVGCACDPASVVTVATMLTSLAMNGDLPDAQFIVADLGLEKTHRDLLHAAVGRRDIRFVDVTDGISRACGDDECLAHLSRTMLARLLLAHYIDEPGARLITIDGSMIVNASLRPLVYRDLGTNYFAGSVDPRGGADTQMFQTGLTLIDVDGYRHYDIGTRAVRWIAEHRNDAVVPDRDALNEVVGTRWHRLAQTWNYGPAGLLPFTTEDYETCKVAHLDDVPVEDRDHPAFPLYLRYERELQRQLSEAHDGRRESRSGSAGEEVVAACYDIFLGRKLEDPRVGRERAHLPIPRLIASVVDSNEFRDNVFNALRDGEPFARHLFVIPPTSGQREWLAHWAPLSSGTATAVQRATSWREILSLVLVDERFTRTIGIDRLEEVAAAIHAP